ncbi:MAG: hypothetical protein VX777_10620 [Chlamydiota bacterium]|nr:hypothetical protein [Chlamydiota bacterium]
MALEIQSTLEGLEKFRYYDRVNNKFNTEGHSMESFSVFKKIILDWQKDLFQDELTTSLGYQKMKAMNVSELASNENGVIPVQLSTVVWNLFHITYVDLKESRAPSEETLAKVHQLFINYANSLPKEQEKAKSDMIQLSLHPRTVTKLVEDKILKIAENHGLEGEFDFDVNERVLIYSDASSSAKKAIRKWERDLFLDKACNKKDYEQIKYTLRLPQLQNAPFVSAFTETSTHLMAIVLNAQEKDGQVTESDMAKMKSAVENLKQYLHNINITYQLIDKVDTAKNVQEEAELHLKNYLTESKEVLAALKKSCEVAQLEYAEAVNGSKHYESLSKSLSGLITQREKTANEAQAALELAQENAEATLSTLRANLDVMKKDYEEALQLSRKAPMNKALAMRVDVRTLDEMQAIADDIPLLVKCFVSYLSFAKGKASRDVDDLSWYNSVTSFIFGN